MFVEPAIVKKINNMKKKKKKRKVVEATITNLEDIPDEGRYSRSYSENDYTALSHQQQIDEHGNKDRRTPASAPVSPHNYISSDDNESQSESELSHAQYKTQKHETFKKFTDTSPVSSENLEVVGLLQDATATKSAKDTDNTRLEDFKTPYNAAQLVLEVDDELDGDLTSMMTRSPHSNSDNIKINETLAKTIAQNPRWVYSYLFSTFYHLES